MQEVLKSKLIEAMKAKDSVRVSVIRFLMSAIKYKEVELRSTNETITEEKIFGVIKKQIKMRNDSIESFKAGNRQDLVEKESAEKAILEEFAAMQTPQA